MVIQAVKQSWKRYPGPTLNQLTPKGTVTYPIRYMSQTFSGDVVDVQGDKNTSADKKKSGINVWSAFSWAKVIGYLFKYMVQLFPSNRLW